MCASNLVKVDAQGNIVGHSDWPINPAGFTFHGKTHQTLPDVHCVMHVHTTPTKARASCKAPATSRCCCCATTAR